MGVLAEMQARLEMYSIELTGRCPDTGNKKMFEYLLKCICFLHEIALETFFTFSLNRKFYGLRFLPSVKFTTFRKNVKRKIYDSTKTLKDAARFVVKMY